MNRNQFIILIIVVAIVGGIGLRISSKRESGWSAKPSAAQRSRRTSRRLLHEGTVKCEPADLEVLPVSTRPNFLLTGSV